MRGPHGPDTSCRLRGPYGPIGSWCEQGWVVMVEGLVKLAQRLPGGRLILDDTTNPKYGLKSVTRKMKITGTSGFAHGYKVLLFFGKGPGDVCRWALPCGTKGLSPLIKWL